MLKKASTIAAVAAGLMMIGSPAFALAGEPHEHSGYGNYNGYGTILTHHQEAEDGNVADQFGLINFGNDSDLASNLNVCQTEVNVIGIPVLAQNDESACVTTDNDDNDGNTVDGE